MSMRWLPLMVGSVFAVTSCGPGNQVYPDAACTEVHPDLCVTDVSIVSVYPGPDAVGVDALSSISVTFSKEMDAASMTAATFLLLQGEQQVEGVVTSLGTTAMLRPKEKLAGEKSYGVIVTRGARDTKGRSLAAEYRWSFTIGKSHWEAPRLLETDDRGSAYDPQLALDAYDNVLAVWLQYDGRHTNLNSKRYNSTTGWEAQQRTVSDERGSATHFSLAMNATGDALVLWDQQYQSLSRIWGTRYSPTAPWATREVLEPEVSQSTSPSVAIDRHGNGVAVWMHGSDPAHLWSGQYVNRIGWVEVRALTPLDIGGASDPQIAADGFGNITVVWLQKEGEQESIWMKRFAPDIGWGEVQRVKHPEAASAKSPRLFVDTEGVATLVWLQSEFNPHGVWTSRYAPGVGWEAASLIEPMDAGSAAALTVAGDSTGAMVAAWEKHEDAKVSLWTSRYEVGIGWSRALRLGTSDVESAQEPRVAMDGHGNAVATWFELQGATTHVWASRYNSAGLWEPPERLDASGNAISPRVVMDSKGRATVVWAQYIGSHFDLWTSRSALANSFAAQQSIP